MRAFGQPEAAVQAREAQRPDRHQAAEGSPAGWVLGLQRSAGNAAVVQMLAGEEESSPVKDVIGSGGGSPLDAGTRTFMEERFGHDFSDVRVHTDARASASAQSVQANAYTVGRDVVFRSDQWSPHTDAGRRTLAHELAHVVQQKAGPVDGSPAPGGIRLSDPSDRFEREADAVADRIMAGTGTGGVQRQAEEAEEEPVQASAAQRQEDEELEGETAGA